MRIAVMGTQAKDLVNFRGHLLSEIHKAGHEAFGIAPGGTPEIRAALDQLGATYVPIAMDRTGMNPLREVWSTFRLWRQLRKLRLDLILTYELKSVVFGTLAARFAGIPQRFAMITGRGTTLQGLPHGFQERMLRVVAKRLYRTALPSTRGVFFQNPDDGAFFAEQGMLPDSVARKIINGSGVDLAHFAQCPLPTGPVTFLFVGRLLRNKGLQEFVQACRILYEAKVPVRCLILGALDSNPNGITAAQLAIWVQEGFVEYLGEVQDVRPVLAKAHVLVLPSYGEGTPRSVLEAMAMGRAVVTTNSPGCRDAVQDDCNGLLVPVGDAQALAAAMTRLAQDVGSIARMAAEGLRLAEQKYDVRLVTQEILDFMGVRPE